MPKTDDRQLSAALDLVEMLGTANLESRCKPNDLDADKEKQVGNADR